jgi:hypothetical protein
VHAILAPLPADSIVIGLESLHGSLPANRIWRAERHVYFLPELQMLVRRGVLLATSVAPLHPVYLRPGNVPPEHEVAEICTGQWRSTGHSVHSVGIVLCDDEKLKTLYLPSER